MEHLADILMATFLVGCSLTAIFRPAVIVHWAQRAQPQLRDDDETALSAARFIGVGGLFVAVLISVVIFRSLKY